MCGVCGGGQHAEDWKLCAVDQLRVGVLFQFGEERFVSERVERFGGGRRRQF